MTSYANGYTSASKTGYAMTICTDHAEMMIPMCVLSAMLNDHVCQWGEKVCTDNPGPRREEAQRLYEVFEQQRSIHAALCERCREGK